MPSSVHAVRAPTRIFTVRVVIAAAGSAVVIFAFQLMFFFTFVITDAGRRQPCVVDPQTDLILAAAGM